MTEYLILWGDGSNLRGCFDNDIMAIMEMFDYCGVRCEWTDKELLELGEKYGVEKLIAIYNKNAYSTEMIKGVYQVEPIYEEITK